MSVEAGKEKGPGGNLYSRARFMQASLEPAKGSDRFDIVEKRLVRIEVDGFVWIRRGSVIAYRGDLKFRRERVLQAETIQTQSGPVRSALKREIVPLARAEGKGVVFVSDDGGHNQVVRLEGGSVYISSSSLLAFEPTLEHSVRMVGGVGLLAGGIFMVKLSGHGLLAFSVKGEPVTMLVSPDSPLSTDPTSTVAWTDSLWPELKTDLEIRNLIAHGGGEAIQMLFKGEGYVIVHAQSKMEAMRAGLIKRIASKIRALIGR